MTAPGSAGFSLQRAPPAVLIAIALALCGCPSGRGDAPPVEVATIRAAHTTAPACRATLTVRTQPDGGEAVTLSLHVWADADGAVRLKVAKLDVDVLDLLLRPDGTYLAWAPRAQEQAQGRLVDADLPPLLPRLALIAAELTQGPLPTGITPADATGALFWTQDGLQVQLTTAADGTARTKTFTRGSETLRLEYGPYQDYDGLRRARRLVFTGLGMSATAILRELAPVPRISPEGMRVVPSATAPVVPLTVLLELLE
jgi:hypothetical protein